MRENYLLCRLKKDGKSLGLQRKKILSFTFINDHFLVENEPAADMVIRMNGTTVFCSKIDFRSIYHSFGLVIKLLFWP